MGLETVNKKAILGTLAIAVITAWFVVVRTAPPTKAFYYWKTEWSASPKLLETLEKNDVGKLYVRFFDVVWDDASNAPYPVSSIKFESPVPAHVEIIPVVYIVNKVFLEMPYADVELLADRVWQKVSAIAAAQGITFQQLQLDCDWSDRTGRSYFHFADILSRRLKTAGKIVSSTIRLHQIKYPERTGIPPVKRGMLMLYNFGRIEADAERSSIFNAEDASRYTSFISSYPLDLDVVLPLFSWTVHSREGRVMGLLEKVGIPEIAAFSGFQRLSPNRYSAMKSFFFRGRYFMAGDLLLVEQTTPQMTQEAAALAKSGAGWTKHFGTVALFDLDEKSLKVYDDNEIARILNSF
jgi:hypothetical protein